MNNFLLKIARKKQVINRLELVEVAKMICKNPEESKLLFNLRHFEKGLPVHLRFDLCLPR